MAGQINLQDTFLNKARAMKVPITVFLVNGFQMRGLVAGFDNFTVIVDSEGKQQLIYKHAISTISPARHIDLSDKQQLMDQRNGELRETAQSTAPVPAPITFSVK